MQNETPKTSTAATFGRSSIARLPPELREAVDAAIADGATIDEIAALIRGEGGACSRSAVGRYTKNVRDLIRQQQETDRANEMWVRALGERAEGRAGLILIETLRTMTLSTMAELSQREDAADAGRARPPGAGSQAHRRHRQAPPRAGAGGGQGSQGRARRGAGAGPGTAQEGPLAGDRRPHRRGRGGVSLSASAPGHIGAGRPVGSCGIRESHLIPLNPGESRPENVSEASSSISLNGGRSLRSLAYAPFGAARSRALRTAAHTRARRPFAIAPRRPAVPPATSWPDCPDWSGYPAIHTRAPVKRPGGGRCPEQVRA